MHVPIIMNEVQWRWWMRTAFLLTLIVICVLAFSPHPPEITTKISDKINHTSAFFALSLLLDQTRARLPYWKGIVPWLIGYGIFIELVQGQLGYREMSVLDVCADSVGIALYGLLRQPVLRTILRLVSFR